MNKFAKLNTKSGLTIHLREATSEDRAILIESFESLSSESRHARFFTVMPHLSNTLIDHLLDLGDRDHLAIVAFGSTTDGQVGPPVGAIQLIKSAQARSGFEFALTVLDAYHKQGIGSALVAAIGVTAQHLGIPSISAEVLAANSGMRRVLTNFEANIRRDPEDAAILHAEMSSAKAASQLEAAERQAIAALFDHLREDLTD